MNRILSLVASCLCLCALIIGFDHQPLSAAGPGNKAAHKTQAPPRPQVTFSKSGPMPIDTSEIYTTKKGSSIQTEPTAADNTPVLPPLARTISVTGEVVDTWCYASQTMGEGRGKKHQSCALACAYGGVTLGILEDSSGKLYIAAKHKAYEGCQALLTPFVGKHVVVSGWLGEKGGCRILKVQKVQLAK